MLYPLSYGGGNLWQDIAVREESQFDGAKFTVHGWCRREAVGERAMGAQ